MTEPSEEELERAERIRRLRSGGGTSRGREMRRQRRAAADDAAGPDREGTAADDRGGGGEAGAAAPHLPPADAELLSQADDLPRGESLFVAPVRDGLRRQFNRVAEQLHLRYGFEFGSELDAERHVRPLALYLGVRALEDSDVAVVRELLASVDELAAPDGVADGPDGDGGEGASDDGTGE